MDSNPLDFGIDLIYEFLQFDLKMKDAGPSQTRTVILNLFTKFTCSAAEQSTAHSLLTKKTMTSHVKVIY